MEGFWNLSTFRPNFLKCAAEVSQYHFSISGFSRLSRFSGLSG